jgi:hypothetical protein
LKPGEVAKEYGVPVEAVMEAIDYCEKNKEWMPNALVNGSESKPPAVTSGRTLPKTSSPTHPK